MAKRSNTSGNSGLECPPPGQQRQEQSQQPGNDLGQLPRWCVTVLPAPQRAKQKAGPETAAVGEVIHIFAACPQHGKERHARGQRDKRFPGLVERRHAAQRAERRKEGGGKAQTDEGMLPEKVVGHIAEAPAQQADEQGMARTGGTRQQRQKDQAEKDIPPEVGSILVQGQGGDEAVVFIMYGDAGTVQLPQAAPAGNIRPGEGATPPAFPPAVPEYEKEGQQGGPACMCMRWRRRRQDRRRLCFSGKGLQFVPCDVRIERRHVQMFPAGKFVKAVGDVARAEEEFPLTLLQIIGKARRRGEAEPEGRYSGRAPAQAIASGALRGAHGGGAVGLGHKKTPASLPGSA